MKRSAPFRIVVLLYVIAWFLPVIKDGATLADGKLPGWEAFRVALAPIMSYGEFAKDTSLFHNVMSVASALTNFLMLLCLFWLAGPATTSRVRQIRWVIVAAAMIDAYWLRLVPDLLLGYYCWLASFVALAVVAFRIPALPGNIEYTRSV